MQGFREIDGGVTRKKTSFPRHHGERRIITCVTLIKELFELYM